MSRAPAIIAAVALFASWRVAFQTVFTGAHFLLLRLFHKAFPLVSFLADKNSIKSSQHSCIQFSLNPLPIFMLPCVGCEKWSDPSPA